MSTGLVHTRLHQPQAFFGDLSSAEWVSVSV
jgi:hypothetical protein